MHMTWKADVLEKCMTNYVYEWLFKSVISCSRFTMKNTSYLLAVGTWLTHWFFYKLLKYIRTNIKNVHIAWFIMEKKIVLSLFWKRCPVKCKDINPLQNHDGRRLICHNLWQDVTGDDEKNFPSGSFWRRRFNLLKLPLPCPGLSFLTSTKKFWMDSVLCSGPFWSVSVAIIVAIFPRYSKIEKLCYWFSNGIKYKWMQPISTVASKIDSLVLFKLLTLQRLLNTNMNRNRNMNSINSTFGPCP